MKETMRYGFILALICMVAAGLLATVNKLTRAKIISQALAEEQAALTDVIPGAAKFSEVKPEADKEALYYEAFDAQGKLIGYVFKASSKGYSSQIETLAGLTLDQKISAIKVISQNETPGLGVKITEDEFRNQFKGQNYELAGVQAISGATISSQAVIESVKKKAKEISEMIKNGK